MRIACGVEYDGSRYYGWQRQSHADSVQQQIEQALSKVANHTVTVICAGRTDAGVHATGQVIHFDTMAERLPHQWLLGANSNLPKDIALIWVQAVSETFHARFKATERAYRYIVHNRPARSAITYPYVSWWIQPLDVERMQTAGQVLLGKHDFSSFRAAECQAKTAVKEVRELSVIRQGDQIYIDVRADGFLHHMVRNIAGALLAIGSREKPVEWVEYVLQARDRTKGGVTAPPNGLYLTHVRYPELFGIPDFSYKPRVA